MRQEVLLEVGATQRLGSILDRYAARRILLVSGEHTWNASGAERRLAPALQGRAVVRFSEFRPNPTLEALRAGLEAAKRSQADLILGVGGGSAMDLAKLIGVFAMQTHRIEDVIHGETSLADTALPIVVLPTTAGSGSQATPFATVWLNKRKYSVTHQRIRPGVAIIDPSLLHGLPRSVAASSGLDALNQGIESYWSIESNEASQDLARRAIELAWSALPGFVKAPTPATSLAMARAAHLAGEAISITRTTAPHAISYPITAHHGVPHGHAVGLVLAAVFRFNAGVRADDVLDPRGVAYVQKTLAEIAGMLGGENVEAGAACYERRMEELGLTLDPKRFWIQGDAAIERIVQEGFDPSRVAKNPRRLTEAALRTLLHAL